MTNLPAPPQPLQLLSVVIPARDEAVFFNVHADFFCVAEGVLYRAIEKHQREFFSTAAKRNTSAADALR